MKEIDAKDIVEVIKNTKKITLPKSKSIKLSKLLTTSTLSSEVEEAIKELEGEYDISGFHIRNKDTHNKLINTIRQAFSDMQQERIDRDGTEQSLSKMVLELQSQIDKVREVVKEINIKASYKALGNIPYIDDKDLKTVSGLVVKFEELIKILGE